MTGPHFHISPRRANRVRLVAVLSVLGPGLVSDFADTDAGGITTYSLAGIKFGYDLLWVILASQIALFFTQELGARLGLATGQGMTGLIRERFGVRWATLAAAAMLIANLGTTVAEFAGIGAALGLFGVPVPVSALVSAITVMVLISWGSFGKVQGGFVGMGIAISAEARRRFGGRVPGLWRLWNLDLRRLCAGHQHGPTLGRREVKSQEVV